MHMRMQIHIRIRIHVGSYCSIWIIQFNITRQNVTYLNISQYNLDIRKWSCGCEAGKKNHGDLDYRRSPGGWSYTQGFLLFPQFNSTFTWVCPRKKHGWWFGCHFWHFPIYWVANHPNWLSYFSEGWPNHQPEETWLTLQIHEYLKTEMDHRFGGKLCSGPSFCYIHNSGGLAWTLGRQWTNGATWCELNRQQRRMAENSVCAFFCSAEVEDSWARSVSAFSHQSLPPKVVAQTPHTMTGWWFETFSIFPYIGLLIIPIDFHIFQRGGPTTNQTYYEHFGKPVWLNTFKWFNWNVRLSWLSRASI